MTRATRRKSQFGIAKYCDGHESWVSRDGFCAYFDNDEIGSAGVGIKKVWCIELCRWAKERFGLILRPSSRGATFYRVGMFSQHDSHVPNDPWQLVNGISCGECHRATVKNVARTSGSSGRN